jgi:hypothetical protein
MRPFISPVLGPLDPWDRSDQIPVAHAAQHSEKRRKRTATIQSPSHRAGSAERKTATIFNANSGGNRTSSRPSSQEDTSMRLAMQSAVACPATGPCPRSDVRRRGRSCGPATGVRIADTASPTTTAVSCRSVPRPGRQPSSRPAVAFSWARPPGSSRIGDGSLLENTTVSSPRGVTIPMDVLVAFPVRAAMSRFRPAASRPRFHGPGHRRPA